jgi:S1-C subfamily serine protease
MAGKAIACRSCGALNDGAGGPPPAQPKREAPSGAKGASTKPVSGESFTVGGKPRAVDQRALEAAYRTAVESKAAAEVARQRERDGGAARLIRSLGIVAFALVVIIVGGLFLVRYLGSKPAGIQWVEYQLAVPQITSDTSTGTGFIIEDKGKLWLVTNFHVIEGASEVTAWFRSPADGSVLFRLPAIPTRDFFVHTQFLSVKESAEGLRNFDLAAVNVEGFRPQIEAIGVVPLEIASSSDFAIGERVVALGHVGTRVFNLASEGDDAAAGVATHSLFDGLVSGIRRAPGKPTLVQTSANYGHGCSGGPLMLEGSLKVAGVNTWGDVNEDGTSKAGMRFALAADQVFGIVRTGSPLLSVRKEIAKGADIPLPQPGDDKEVLEWSTSPGLEALVDRFLSQGWQLAGLAVQATSVKGAAVYRHRVQGQGGTVVAVLALPRDRSINIDIPEITGEQFRGLGSSIDSAHGRLAAIGVCVPGTTELASMQPGFELDIHLQSLFLGEPIAARYLIVILERPAGATPP